MTATSGGPVTVVGVPLDLGSGRRGVDMGPFAIRYANLHAELERMGREVEDRGNLRVPIRESSKAPDSRVRYESEIRLVCSSLAGEVARAARKGAVPVVLGGDHSVAMGSVVGAARIHGRLGLLWFDAHGDFNTPQTSPSGNVHGMPLAVIMGYGSRRLVTFCKEAGIAPRNCALVGVRDLDPLEKDLLMESGIRVYTMETIDRLGLGAVMEQAVGHVTSGTMGFHLSFDVDVLDPSAAPGVGTPAHGGITYRESMMALEIAAATGQVRSIDMVEVNPILDVRNQTAQLAVSLIATALGKKIL